MKKLYCVELLKVAVVWCVLFNSSAPARANQPVYIAMATVGNAGNAADIGTGYGARAYVFRIGKYDVTQSQYAAFLNAVAATDTYGLYDTRMATDLIIAGISRSGTSGSYTYAVIGTGNQPIGHVTWFSAARFANWMHNGQPSGAQGPATTEQGTYTLNGATSGIILKNAGAQFWIPTGNEWYKAAYYDPTLNSGTGGYWQYPTRSNTPPGNVVGSGTNQANIYVNGTGYSVTQSTATNLSQNYLTDVGSYTGSAGYYGTFDMGGNVFQWNDDVISGTKRGFRGGSWAGSAAFLLSSYNPGVIPTQGNEDYGFRISALESPPVTAAETVPPSIAVSGSNVSITVKGSVKGRTYQLQMCDDLVAGNWQDIGLAQSGTGSDLVISTVYDPVAPHRFYRLKLS